MNLQEMFTFKELYDPCETCLVQAVCKDGCIEYSNYWNVVASYEYRSQLDRFKTLQKKIVVYLKRYVINSPSITKMFQKEQNKNYIKKPHPVLYNKKFYQKNNS